MVVAGVAIDDVEILNLIEMMFGSVGGEDGGHTGVETATEYGAEPGLLETLAVCPLPGIFKVRLVFRLIVGGVEIVAPRLQTGLHDGEVLIREGEIHDEVGLEGVEELYELRHFVGIHLRSLDVCAETLVFDIFGDGIAL